MNEQLIKLSVELLKEKGIHFDRGLTNSEITEIETLFGINFPLDLKLFLQTGFPISKDFANWRLALTDDTEKKNITNLLNWPLDGMLFDIDNNSFWVKDWGTKPESQEEQHRIAEKNYLLYPKLIPIYSHRFIPSRPLEVDNPIISVYQMDIIYYGYDLLSYFEHEFEIELPETYTPPEQPKKIEFWDLVIENAGDPF
jgi:hypothetical protein